MRGRRCDGATVGRWDGATVGRWDGATVGQFDSVIPPGSCLYSVLYSPD
ncbi:hypothetical protein ACFLT1_00380 [Bacteroidota bacterium]